MESPIENSQQIPKKLIAEAKSDNNSIVNKTVTGSNTTAIGVDYYNGASSYPSTINISGETDPIKKVKVTLNGLSHYNGGDLDIMLVGPQGQKVMLMSDASDGYYYNYYDSYYGDYSYYINNPVYGADVTFDDSATSSLSSYDSIYSGSYKPTDYETGDTFATPAPAGPYGTSLSVFNGTSPNGTWSLYIQDDADHSNDGYYYYDNDSGSISSWSLDIIGSNDALITTTISPASVNEDGNNKLVYTFTRDGSTVDPLTVNFQVGGTGTFNTDYTQLGATTFNDTTGTVTFAAGSSTAAISLTPQADADIEEDETVTISVNSGNGYYTDSTDPVVGTINDDDSAKTLNINFSDGGYYDATGFHEPSFTDFFAGDARYTYYDYYDGTEYTYGSVYRNFLVFDVPSNLSSTILSAELKIDYPYVGSSDYSETYQLNAVTTPISTLTAGGTGLTDIYDDLGDGKVYGKGEVTYDDYYSSVSIPLNSDFISDLNAAKGSQIALGGLITTLDNIPNYEYLSAYYGAQLAITYAPAGKAGISVDDITLVEGQSNTANFIVKLSQASATNVTVKYTTSDDSALAGSDYTAKSGTITFAPGEVSKEISIPIVNNNISESDEQFKLILSNNSTNSFINDSQAIATLSDTISSNVTFTLTNAVENLQLTETANINGIGNNNTNLITGNGGKNQLKGKSGNDTLDGGIGDDTLDGGIGSDFLQGSSGNDNLSGDKGDDIYAFVANSALGTDKIKELIGGNLDTIDLTGTNYSVKLNLGLTSVQTVVSSNLKLQLSSNKSIENVISGSGNDKITGNTENNVLTGGDGKDQLYGNGGKDTLNGGEGDDLLVGGLGSDSFVYQTSEAFNYYNTGTDTISDFSSSDKVILSKTTFGLTSNIGNRFSQASEFAVVNDDDDAEISTAKIVFSKNSRTLFYNQDGSTAGFGTGGEFAGLGGISTLTANNFAIIA